MKNKLFIQKLVGTAILAAVVISLQLILGSIKLCRFRNHGLLFRCFGK